ncbi:Pol protein [Phytophthora palmivora]|uniref:Pol protein n=1 Tax=Phytophthora palmivora TaxID=4796 RepID=A0A2P4XN37_9STRA|nr:Pol protein [Phytophthora palmivora]
MSEGEAFGPRLDSTTEPSCVSGLLEVDEPRLRLQPASRRKMAHLAPVRDKVTGKQTAQLFLDSVFHYHGLPEAIVSDRDPRFTGALWDTLFQLLGTKLTMSTADHAQTDGQTERVNRVLEDTLRSICAEAPRSWSDQLPMIEFALNNAVHASTGFTPFYLKRATTSPGAVNLAGRHRGLHQQTKEYSDKNGRGNLSVFMVGDLVVLDAKKLPLRLVSPVESSKLKHRFI